MNLLAYAIRKVRDSSNVRCGWTEVPRPFHHECPFLNFWLLFFFFLKSLTFLYPRPLSTGQQR